MQTYDEILQRMTDKYTESAGIAPSENSDISIRLRILAGEIYSNLVNMEWLKRQMFVDSAQGQYLDLHAQERGLVRRSSCKATGKVQFSVSEAQTADLAIPKGTVLAAAVSLLRFETTEDAVLSAGKTSVTVNAQSVGEGSEYNVMAKKITVMVTPPAGIDSVTNSEPFTGGCDLESDESLRQRIIATVKFPANSTNCAYYEAVAESMDGVSSACAVPRGRGLGTVDVYIAADGCEASDATVNKVQTNLSQLREVNVDVLVKKATATEVSFYINMDVYEGYDFDEVKANCISEITGFIASRGVGGEVLMCQISELIYHVEGVMNFAFVSQLNSDFKSDRTAFPVAGVISVTRSNS